MLFILVFCYQFLAGDFDKVGSRKVSDILSLGVIDNFLDGRQYIFVFEILEIWKIF